MLVNLQGNLHAICLDCMRSISFEVLPSVAKIFNKKKDNLRQSPTWKPRVNFAPASSFRSMPSGQNSRHQRGGTNTGFSFQYIARVWYVLPIRNGPESSCTWTSANDDDATGEWKGFGGRICWAESFSNGPDFTKSNLQSMSCEIALAVRAGWAFCWGGKTSVS